MGTWLVALLCRVKLQRECSQIYLSFITDRKKSLGQIGGYGIIVHDNIFISDILLTYLYRETEVAQCRPCKVNISSTINGGRT